MKLFPISDTHLDMRDDDGIGFIDALKPHPDTALVIAGDLSEHYLIDYLLREFCSLWKYVIYVPGNHEYWHCTMSDVDNMLEELDAEIDNLYVLQNKVIEIEGVRFVGATLWFEQTPLHITHGFGWSDFVQIHDGEPGIYQAHNRTRWFLEQNLRQGDVVVTHHLPSYSSCHKRFQGSLQNIFYANRLDLMIEDIKPKLWIHGHTHDSNDYKLGETRVISNPFGYPHDINPAFRSGMVIEV